MTSCYVAVPKTTDKLSSADCKQRGGNGYFSKGARSGGNMAGGYIEEGDYMGEGGGANEGFMGQRIVGGAAVVSTKKSDTAQQQQRKDVSMYMAPPGSS